MFNLSLGEIGSVNVVTSDKGGLSNDQIAEMAANKIVYVSESAPPAIKEQAHVFSDKVKNLLRYYVDLARKEERATIVQQIKDAGQPDLANIIRRL
jgi:hypothetical protein|tara:strand:- start:193 stop:480 length:288 start_codon:yes stop_codon:yes gene_type:complete